MNIGIDIRPLMSPTRTGVGEYTCELISAILKEDKKNQYFLFYNSYSDVSENIPDWKQDNVKYVITRWPNKLFNGLIKMTGMPKLDKIINNLDIFFSPNLNFTSLSKKTKFILTVHDLPFELFPEFFSPRQRLWHKTINPKKQCRRADLILVPSENTKRDVVDRYKINPEKIKVLYHGLPQIFYKKELVDNQKIKEKYNLPGKFILFLGTVELRKNITGLIKAFEMAQKSLPANYSLVIAGTKGWDYKKIYECACSSSIKEKIKFIGYVEPNEKPALYSLSHLFVYPSFYEGFGFPVIEAMACGTPVITSNRSSLPEITENAACLINPNNTASISQGIIKVLNDKNIRERFISQGTKQAQKFNWAETAQKWLTLASNICV